MSWAEEAVLEDAINKRAAYNDAETGEVILKRKYIKKPRFMILDYAPTKSVDDSSGKIIANVFSDNRIMYSKSTGASMDNPSTFCSTVYKDNVYFYDGKKYIYKFDGETTTLIYTITDTSLINNYSSNIVTFCDNYLMFFINQNNKYYFDTYNIETKTRTSIGSMTSIINSAKTSTHSNLGQTTFIHKYSNNIYFNHIYAAYYSSTGSYSFGTATFRINMSTSKTTVVVPINTTAPGPNVNPEYSYITGYNISTGNKIYKNHFSPAIIYETDKYYYFIVYVGLSITGGENGAYYHSTMALSPCLYTITKNNGSISMACLSQLNSFNLDTLALPIVVSPPSTPIFSSDTHAGRFFYGPSGKSYGIVGNHTQFVNYKNKVYAINVCIINPSDEAYKTSNINTTGGSMINNFYNPISIFEFDASKKINNQYIIKLIDIVKHGEYTKGTESPTSQDPNTNPHMLMGSCFGDRNPSKEYINPYTSSVYGQLLLLPNKLENEPLEDYVEVYETDSFEVTY